MSNHRDVVEAEHLSSLIVKELKAKDIPPPIALAALGLALVEIAVPVETEESFANLICVIFEGYLTEKK